MAKLRERIDALEAKAPAVQQEQDAALRAFRAKAERRLLEKIEDARAGRDRYGELDAAGRIRYWQKRIADAREWLAKYSEAPEPMKFSPFCTMSPGVRESFHRTDWLLTLKTNQTAPDREWLFELVSAQLDRLIELGYPAEKMKLWLVERERWKSFPWQWRPENIVLTPDALELLK